MTKSDLRNIIEENRNLIKEFSPDKMMTKIQYQGQVLESRISQVIAKRIQLDEEYRVRKLKIVHRKEIQEAEVIIIL
jgi:hypothetical protein